MKKKTKLQNFDCIIFDILKLDCVRKQILSQYTMKKLFDKCKKIEKEESREGFFF